MTGNELPSATGVRIAGDEYQWLHVWRACMEALHHDLTKNTNNPTIAIGVEEPGVGNGDDVVRYRQRPPHVYTQVKYAVKACEFHLVKELAPLDDWLDCPGCDGCRSPLQRP